MTRPSIPPSHPAPPRPGAPPGPSTPTPRGTPPGPGRRALMKGAGWAAPALVVSSVAPALAASPPDVIDVGAFQVRGSCGVLGLIGPGFDITAGERPLPAGTTITVTGSGIANIGVFSATGGAADISVLSGRTRVATLTQPLPAAARLQLRTTLSLGLAYRLNAELQLPSGYGPGIGAVPAGSLESTLLFCSAS